MKMLWHIGFGVGPAKQAFFLGGGGCNIFAVPEIRVLS